MRDRPVSVPASVASEAPITSGDELVGAVLLLAGDGKPAPEALEYLHLAAVACLTEVAVAEAREEVEENLRGSFIDDLRSRPDLDPADVVRRAARLGCDLSRGVVALCAELSSDRPRHVVATISGDYPGALAQHLEGGGVPRVHALLPATGGDGAPEQTLARARTLAERLGRHGTVGLSSFYADPADIGRAIQEAELVLDVLRRSDGGSGEGLQDIGTGTYRLLFRVLASHPEEVRSFYEDTIAPVVRYDDQYRTDLIGTLEAYFEQNCNMNATAAAIYAHRHTVAYRLDRVRELSGLDATQSEDRERLGLGLKAYRIIIAAPARVSARALFADLAAPGAPVAPGPCTCTGPDPPTTPSIHDLSLQCVADASLERSLWIWLRSVPLSGTDLDQIVSLGL